MSEAVIQVNFHRLLSDKELRDNTRYSVAEVARATGLSRQSVYLWLSGEISTVKLASLAAVCRFLGCRPGDVLTLEVEEGEPA